MKYHIGTSGWQYNHWKKRFYPEDVPKKKWLEFYAKEFDSVEVNGTFYGPIKKKTFKKWYKSVPYDFKFTLKGSRWITHMKKLSGVKKAVDKFYERARPLKHKLGCVLWQLPPILKKDIERLDDFCRVLDNRKNNVIEFRDKSWFDNEVYDVLKDKGVGFCVLSASGLPDIMKITSDILYVRFHGKGRWYSSLYSEKEMDRWAKNINTKIGNIKIRVKNIYCYFNNDSNAYAVKNAKMLRKKLEAKK